MIAHIERQGFSGSNPADGKPHRSSLLRQVFGDADADPICAPVDDHHRLAYGRLTLQHLPGIHDLQSSFLRKVRPVGFGARGDEHHIGCRGQHRGPINACATADLHAGQLQLVLEIGDEAAEFRPPGQHLREQHLTAETPLRFE